MAPDVASQANPFFGVVLHSIGGLAAASFYIRISVRDCRGRHIGWWEASSVGLLRLA
jgi:hypothetical protein